MNIKIKKMLPFVLGGLLSVSAFAEDVVCEDVTPAAFSGLDASQYSLRQVQNGLNRSFFFFNNDLNDAKLLKGVLNEIGLKELNQLITEGKNPVPGDSYIEELIENNRINPNDPKTIALYFDAKDEPVSNPILGEVLSIIFENGSKVSIEDSFDVNIDVATQESKEALTMKLTVKKKGEWLFDITELDLNSIDKFDRDPNSLSVLALKDFLITYLALNYLHGVGYGFVGGVIGTFAEIYFPIGGLNSPDASFRLSGLGGVVGFISGVYVDGRDQIVNHGQMLTPSVRAMLTLTAFGVTFTYDFMNNHYPYWVSYFGSYFDSETTGAREEL